MVEQAFLHPVGFTERLKELARGKKSAVIVVDDITRPTPIHRFFPNLINELVCGGIDKSNIRILVGTGAHRPMSHDEIRKKLTAEIVEGFTVIIHDFMGPDIRNLGWIEGGPVHLNRHFLQADMRICVGCVIPHNETGFGGGAKMVVPGLAGHLTIAHFHGALPPRPSGHLEPVSAAMDRRAWAEKVARVIGVDAVICAVVNSKRQLAGLYIGDLVKAHRAAAQRSAKLGQTVLTRDQAENCDIVIVNCYPLDTDPIQMAKAVEIGKKISPKCLVVINAATDGIFYHGMGMGSGVSVQRLVRNFPFWLCNPRKILTWLRSMVYAVRSPKLVARLCYYSWNNLSYSVYKGKEGRLPPDVKIKIKRDEKVKMMLVFSTKFPSWGFAKRYPEGLLYRDWSDLSKELSKRFSKPPKILLFPCAPLQILSIT